MVIGRDQVPGVSGTNGSNSRENSENANRDAAGGVRVVWTYGGSVSLPAMEKLKGRANYASWSFAMKMTLIREGSWQAVRAAANEEVDPDLNGRAMATICLAIEKNNYSLVRNAVTAREVWSNLQKAFQDNGLIRRFGLLDRLTSVKLEDSESVEDYVDALVTTANDLSEIGFEVNDQWLASLLLKGLPAYYNPMIMGLQASGMELTADLVKTKILQDVKWPLEGGSSSVDGALYTRQRSRPKGGAEKKPGACYSCGQMGHFIANCPTRKNVEKTEEKQALHAMLVKDSCSQDEWFFDSAASSHMARGENGFQKQVDLDHSIQTANNQSMRAVAKGVVNLELDQGLVEIQEVLHVPNLATNLL